LVYQLKEGTIDFVSAAKIYHLELHQVLKWVSGRTRIEDERWDELYGWMYPNYKLKNNSTSNKNRVVTRRKIKKRTSQTSDIRLL